MRSFLALALGWSAASRAEPAEPRWAPSDTTAVLLSSRVGFGSGHFYAGNREEGGAHAMLQGLGLGVGLAGGMILAGSSGQHPTSDADAARLNGQYTTGVAIIGAGAIVFVVDRLVDIARAPRSVRRAIEEGR